LEVAMAVESQGVYRIPYQAGTKVRVNRDHFTHDPLRRYDMKATGGGPYRIAAAADGVIRFIVDGFTENRPGASPCNNNYVWIEHPTGEWTKYSLTRGHEDPDHQQQRPGKSAHRPPDREGLWRLVNRPGSGRRLRPTRRRVGCRS
jgi:hypothetical protein